MSYNFEGIWIKDLVIDVYADLFYKDNLSKTKAILKNQGNMIMKNNYKSLFFTIAIMLFLSINHSYCSASTGAAEDDDVSSNSTQINPEALYAEAVDLRKSNSLVEAHAKFLEVVEQKPETDLAVKALYNIGWIANKRTWYDQCALYLLRSNALHQKLHSADFDPAVKSLDTLKSSRNVRETVSLEDFPDGDVDFNWTATIATASPLGSAQFNHTPVALIIDKRITIGGAFVTAGGSINEMPINSNGIWIMVRMSKRDFINSLTHAGLNIVSVIE